MKRVLITAGAAGLGRAMTEGFVAEGARVAVCDRGPVMGAGDGFCTVSAEFCRTHEQSACNLDADSHAKGRDR